MVQKLQDQVLKDRVLRFIEQSTSPEVILRQSTSQATKENISAQLKQACSTELADVVLRLSTEDTFDLLCDLSVRHGRDLKTYGPPCACSFSHCLPCLERLVTSIKSTTQNKPPDIKKVRVKEMEDWMESYWEEESWEDDEIQGQEQEKIRRPLETGKLKESEKLNREKFDWNEQWNRACDLKDKNQLAKKKDLTWKDAILGAWKGMADMLCE